MSKALIGVALATILQLAHSRVFNTTYYRNAVGNSQFQTSMDSSLKSFLREAKDDLKNCDCNKEIASKVPNYKELEEVEEPKEKGDVSEHFSGNGLFEGRKIAR